MRVGSRLIGKTVVVTGASGNLGRAITKRFSDEGANVVAIDRTSLKHSELIQELGADRTLALTADVTKLESFEPAIQEGAKRFGGIDVLISNVGNAILKPFATTTLDDWEHLIAVNATSGFLGAKIALPYLKESQGNIVNIAAIGALGGGKKMAAFNAAKGAVVNFTRGLSVDLGPLGIRVNSVAPSLTIPEERTRSGEFDELIRRSNERQSLRVLSTPDDVAAAVTFLASKDARFITGVILPVDGGITAASGEPEYS